MKHSLFQPGTNTFAEAEGITNKKFACDYPKTYIQDPIHNVPA